MKTFLIRHRSILWLWLYFALCSLTFGIIAPIYFTLNISLAAWAVLIGALMLSWGIVVLVWVGGHELTRYLDQKLQRRIENDRS